MFKKLNHLIREDPVFGILLFYDIAFAAVLIALLIQRGEAIYNIYTVVALAIFIGLTIAHRFVAKPIARNTFVILFAVLVGVALPEADYVPFVLIFPVLTSLMIADYKWILGAGVTTYFLMLYRADFGGIYTDFFSIVLYAIAVLGAMGARYIISRTGEKLASTETEKENLEIIVEGLGDGVAVIDPLWKVEVWNARAQEITGFSKAEALGKRITEVMKIIDENTRQESYGFITDAITRGKRTNMASNTLLVKKDGTEVHVGDSAAPLLNTSGELSRLIIVFRDMAQERAGSRLTSDFAYAQHQLRTPLTEVRWAIEIAKSAKNPEESKAALDSAENSVESAVKLANDLVTVSELENKMWISKPAMVSLTQIVEAALNNVHPLIDKTGVKIEVNPISHVEGLNTDKEVLVKVLTELLSNAITYRKNESPILLTIKRESSEYIFEISGAQKPISPAEQPLVFTKFFRGSNKPENSVGSGLGLYITKKLTELIGGRIWFKSDENNTTFYVAIPVDK